MTHVSLVDEILRRVRAGGSDPAVIDADGVASYDDLRALVGGIAARLRAADVAPGDHVGMAIGKGRHETAALLGVWAAGGVGVPLDTTSPAQRNTGILAGCGTRVAVVEDLAAAAALGVRGVTTGDGDDLTVTPCTSDVAIVLHTSGSSGTPKGVPIRHEGVDAFVLWMSAQFDVRPGAHVAALASLTFDLALFEQLAPLAVGGAVVRPSDRLALSARKLAEFLDGAGVTHIYAVPSFYTRLHTATPMPEFAALRAVLFAGEAFPVASLRAVRAAWPGRVFANLFGPTETNVCTYHVLRDADPADSGLPIGQPCPYAEIVLLSDDALTADGSRTPADEGEICVRGATALAEYVGEDAPTVREVVVDGHGPAPFVRTGDLASRDEHGILHFHGRRDDMLKVRGFRVEPGEVEAALASHAAVSDAVVARETDEKLGEFLVARVALVPGAEVDPRILRAHVATLVPAYMVPMRIDVVDALPRSERGKRRRESP